ncbi:14815_t:CDS:2 [Racocetra fulgida]|uniref:14815_t:CDS:1 n=1 Tax=Racocetra fulgida TaxID=60492 RepID=A0A9N8WJ15_9GLOM|nr:14815_t:CDS:2 [Racocetra fulgida]
MDVWLAKLKNLSFINEADKQLSICIDATLIIFLANACPNLKDIQFKFSSKARPDKPWKLPLNLLSDRLIRINLTTYEHVVNDVDALDDFDKVENIKNEVSTPQNFARSIANLFTTSSKPKQINFNNNDVNNNFDALCEAVLPDPSEIAILFGKYCKNLRKFDLEALQCPPISYSAMSFMFDNCLKLEKIDAPISGEVLNIIHTSKSLKSISFNDIVQGQSLKATFKMNNLQSLVFLKIDGSCNLSFLEMFPNLQYIQIWDFPSFNYESFRRISQTSIKQLDLLKPSNISDEVLTIFVSMTKLINFTICDRLPNVTQDGWLSFVNRPTGCPSWVDLSIGDGRKVSTEFFEILNKNHKNLEALVVRGLTGENLDDSVMQKLKFKGAWNHCKRSSHLHLHWPKQEKRTNIVEICSYKSY